MVFLTVAAVAEPSLLVWKSFEVAPSNDFPLGEYQTLSSDNLGVSLRYSFGLPEVAFPFSLLNVYFQLDNAYWVSHPDWVTQGTEVNTLAGAALLLPLAVIPQVGTVRAGGSFGYGLMSHWASANTGGQGSQSYFFLDQTLLVDGEVSFQADNSPLGGFLRGRYLFSPEKNNLKSLVGVLVGLRYSSVEKNPEAVK